MPCVAGACIGFVCCVRVFSWLARRAGETTCPGRAGLAALIASERVHGRELVRVEHGRHGCVSARAWRRVCEPERLYNPPLCNRH
jgi:hypothetical protein